MTSINSGSLLTDGWTIIKDIFYDQVSDIVPSTSSRNARSGSEFVVSAWPNRVNYSRAKWLEYPFVVLRANLEGGRNKTMNAQLKEKRLAFEAQVYDKSQVNADKMANQINEILDVSQLGLEGSKLEGFEVDSIDSGDIIDPGDAVVHVKTIKWHYDYVANK